MFTGKKSGRRVVVIVLLLGMLPIEGCYYMQAIRGQFEIMGKRQPIAEVISSEAAPDDLKNRLAIVQQARDFAVEELFLPDNKSYRTYADLGRDYVVWNVFAAPEFSLEPKTWCYPVAGCVVYRGYFSEANADKLAAKLARQGLDVIVGGVAAYSTLGRFDDPVLNTMLRWSELYLVETLFHELAHQKIYVKGDSAYNESFATAVAEISMERWLSERGESERFAHHMQFKELQASIRELVSVAREELDALYASNIGEDEMRDRKRRRLDKLSDAAQRVLESSEFDAKNWLAAPLNNAKLVSLGVYEGNLSAFRMILQDCDDSMDCFYRESAALAELSIEEREGELIRLDERYAELASLSLPSAQSEPAR